MINSVTLIGNLGADPETQTFQSGSVKATFVVYVNKRYTNSKGETQEKTTRVLIEVWGKTAEFAAKYLHTGSKVAITGELDEQVWSVEGQTRSRLVVRANRIENLSPKSDADRGVEEF